MDNKTTTINVTGNGMVYPPVKVKTSGKDVIASGSVNTFSHDNLEIEIAQFKFVFNFINSGTEQKIEYRNDGPEVLILDIYNFTNALGTGVSSPIRIGTLMDRELFLVFMVYTTSPTAPKLVHYTFSLGDRVA
ncbi:Conserved hypothetical protein [Vibrio chagasii]|nr:Conserved hypothetical protein [Vibrio chagasii]CAH7303530.1 conserved hypothetical protein [Vibrio chagasii]CAH7339466.1 conserved hypothetical protein [Vibrio chagasii]CAH7455925.1 conserved hypothetical protein [Vibrio chagasii]